MVEPGHESGLLAVPWLRFRLAWLFVAMSCAAGLFSWRYYHVRNLAAESEAAATLNRYRARIEREFPSGWEGLVRRCLSGVLLVDDPGDIVLVDGYYNDWEEELADLSSRVDERGLIVAPPNDPLGDDAVEVIGRLTSVRRVDLGRSSVTDDGLAHLARLRGLTSLDLRGDAVTDRGLAHLAGCDALKELTLSGTQITDAGMAHLAGLPALKRLRLGVSYQGRGRNRKTIPAAAITDEGLSAVGRCTTLEQLELRGLPITDRGLEAIAKLPRLRVLDLVSTHVTDPGLERLAQFPVLGEVTVSEEVPVLMGPGPTTRSDVSTEAVERLRRAKPGLTVKYLPPSVEWGIAIEVGVPSR